jgi:hypothetical protein
MPKNNKNLWSIFYGQKFTHQFNSAFRKQYHLTKEILETDRKISKMD